VFFTLQYITLWFRLDNYNRFSFLKRNISYVIVLRGKNLSYESASRPQIHHCKLGDMTIFLLLYRFICMHSES
jgi:hypothetical protein